MPLFEKTSVDEFYVDFTGTEKFFGALKLATELRQYISKETGLPNSFGLSINKTVSKVATNTAKPNNFRQVERGTEKPFLAPMEMLVEEVGAAKQQRDRRCTTEMAQPLLVEFVERDPVFGFDEGSFEQRGGLRVLRPQA